MNFLQTYRRHLIFKLAGIAAVILAVLSSAYLFMSADYARSVRKNTLALNERLTAQTATRIEASWDSLYNITTAFCYSPHVLSVRLQRFFQMEKCCTVKARSKESSDTKNRVRMALDMIRSFICHSMDVQRHSWSWM